MSSFCYRCHASLEDGAAFCSQCGAQQLYVSSEQLEEAAAEAPATSNEGVRPNTVDWQLAIRVALTISVIAAVLKLASMKLPMLGLANLLWILGASGTALWLYARKSPQGRMDGRTGARIGLVVGIGIAMLTSLVSAGWMVAERYGMHHGAAMDAEFATLVAQIAEFYKRAGIDQKTQEMVFSLLRSPEGKAGQQLSAQAARAIEICLFLSVSGAISGMIRGSRQRLSR